MKRRRHAVDLDVLTLPRSAIVAGPVRVIHPAIRALGVPWQYDPRRRAYLVPLAVADDLAAALEHAGYNVTAPLIGGIR